MYPPGLLSWRIAFVLYLFFHLASSAAVVRKSALTDPGSAPLDVGDVSASSGASGTDPFVWPTQNTARILSASVTIITTRTAVSTTIGGIPTITDVLTTSTSTLTDPRSAPKDVGDVGAVAGTDTAPFLRPALNTQSFSASITVITTLTAVPTTIDGIPTFTDVLTTSTSTSFVPIGTGRPAEPNDDTPSHSHNPAVIAVSVSVGAIAVLSLILFVTMRRRRALRTRTQISPLQRQESFKETRPYLGSKSDAHRASWAPDIDTDGPRSSIISMRQLVISNQVNRAREKVAELEEISSLLRFSSYSSREDRTRQASDLDVLPPAAAGEDSVNNPSDADSLGVQDKLERAIRQIEGLNNRIHELERQRRSSWALGRSDEPPPGYTEDPE